MLDSAFDSLVVRRQHVALSSDRSLALQQGAALLLRRLKREASVRVAAEAPLDPAELIEHVNRIVSGLPLHKATAVTDHDPRPAILPVWVGPDRPADSITLLATLCRALPGTGLCLLLIVEYRPSLTACLAALGASALHLEVRDEHLTGAVDDAPDAGAVAVTEAPPAPAVRGAERAAPADGGTGTGRSPSPHRVIHPVLRPFASLANSATRRPLRFALLVAGIPGLLIAALLAIGSALLPSRPGPGNGTPTSPPTSASGVREPAAKPAPKAVAAIPAAGPQTAPLAQIPAAGPETAPLTQAPGAQVRTPNPTPAATPVPPTAAALPAPVAAAPELSCTRASSALPQAQARNPSKDSGMVYLTSSRPVTVCITDGSGSTERHELRPEQGRSFYGRAPWQLQATALRDLQIYFQGSRITLPRDATDRIELIERADRPGGTTGR